jgi:hypothetical protein
MPTYEASRARLAVLTRWRKPGHPDIANADRDVRAAFIARMIRKYTDPDAPFTTEQRDALCALIRNPETTAMRRAGKIPAAQ